MKVWQRLEIRRQFFCLSLTTRDTLFPLLFSAPRRGFHHQRMDVLELTFPESYKLQANGETLALQHFAPAHTNSDIYVHFQKANVIQMGDTFFNGMYPYTDPGTGGKITGMMRCPLTR